AAGVLMDAGIEALARPAVLVHPDQAVAGEQPHQGVCPLFPERIFVLGAVDGPGIGPPAAVVYSPHGFLLIVRLKVRSHELRIRPIIPFPLHPGPAARAMNGWVACHEPLTILLGDATGFSAARKERKNRGGVIVMET